LRRRENGFTLVELLVAVGIIAILVAIAVPNLLTAINRSKQKRTMADMRSISTAWEARATDMARYNAAGVSGISVPITMDDVSTMISPTYIKEVPRYDGWSRQFSCYLDQDMGGPSANAYAIISAGRDGSISATVYTGPFASFDCDIIFSNGAFLSYPEGVQR
jgi:type II secretion system protein G